MRLEDSFKETDFGPIPVDWEVVRLGDEIGPHGKKNKDEHPFPVYTVSNVFGFILSDEFFDKRVYSRDLSTYKIVEKGDFAYNPYRINVGSLGLFTNENPGLVSPAYVVFRVCSSDRLDPRFLFLLLKSDRWLSEIRRMAMSRGSVRRSLAFRDLAEFRTPLPPLPEQRRIAHVLSTIQRAIAAQDDLIAAAREVKRSLMQRLFTYGPGPEPAPTKETRFGQVPEHWEIMPLETCAFVQTGAAKGRKLGDSRTVTVPYLRVANVQDGYLDLAEIKHIQIRESEVERYGLQPGDVVLTEGGDFDKLGRGFIWRGEIQNCVHQNHIFAVRVDREKLLPEYLAYLVQSDYGKSYFLAIAHRTTHLACINKAKLKAFPVLVPDLGEQERIASQLSVADRKIEGEEQRKAALQALFKTMLQQLMTGQVRV